MSAYIASEACKQLNIPLIGRCLTTTTNKSDEISVADLVGKVFCTDFKTVNISDECEAIITALESAEGKSTNLQKGNIKARYRMIYLRNLGSIHKGVVLDNDNFTEYNIGFFTIGGDQFDVNCGIHYLWKTEIYELGNIILNNLREKFEERDLDDPKYIKYKERFNAVSASLRLTPTDGNGVSNSDCEQFGLDNYEQVDDVLKTMYYSKLVSTTKFKEKIEQYKKQGIALVDPERAHHFKEYIRLIDSYNEQGVDKVMLLHQNTKYKRKELPIKPTKKELGL